MATMKEQVAKVTSNPIGAVVGGVAVFMAAKKLGKVTNKWALIGLTVVGVVAGALAQNAIKAKKSEPKKDTVVTK
jgi:general stress protein CsbA